MNELIPTHLARLAALGGSRQILQTADGPLDAYHFAPAHSSSSSSSGMDLLFYCDAGGVRPAMFELARRLADFGHTVLMPNLYHRLGTYAPFEAATVFDDAAELKRLLGMIASLNEASAMRDTAACLDALQGPIGVLGYCLGGSMALRAAGYFKERVVAAASIHGGGLATDAPDSPHRLAGQIQARLYLGVAGIDPHFPQSQQALLESALQAAEIDYALAVFETAQHGFAVPDMPVYDPPGAEANWANLQAFFARP